MIVVLKGLSRDCKSTDSTTEGLSIENQPYVRQTEDGDKKWEQYSARGRPSSSLPVSM